MKMILAAVLISLAALIFVACGGHGDELGYVDGEDAEVEAEDEIEARHYWTTVAVSESIELVAMWGQVSFQRDAFLSQFESYVAVEIRWPQFNGWVAIGAAADLLHFRYFRLERGEGGFFPGEILAARAVVQAGEPLVLPWQPDGVKMGISFVDEWGVRRYFSLGAGAALPPLEIEEFVQVVPPSILPAQVISEHGRQVTAQFVQDWWGASVSWGWACLETGQFFTWAGEPLAYAGADGVRRLFFGGTQQDEEYAMWYYWLDRVFEHDGHSFFDYNGHFIDEAPFLRAGGPSSRSVASGFTFYDLDGDGIPEVIIYFWYTMSAAFSGFPFAVMLRYVDGEFREVGHIGDYLGLFIDPRGEIILVCDNGYNGMYGYYSLRFPDGGLDVVMMINPSSHSSEAWYSHHSHPVYGRSNFFAHPTMFGCETPLQRIYPLTDLF